MAQTFYSLEEAANVLGIAADDLDQLRKDGLIKGDLVDGTWHFRGKEVKDYQLMHGPGSVPDLDASGPADGGLPPLDAGGVPTGGDLDAGGSGPDFELSGEGQIAVPPVSAVGPGPGKQSSVLKMAPEDIQVSAFDDSGEFSSTGSLEAPPPQGASQVSLGTEPLPLAGGTGASSANLGATPPVDPLNPGGASDVRLTLESGSFEFDLTVDSSGRLAGASAPPPGSQPRKTTPGKTGASGPRIAKSSGDSDVRLDFDSHGGAADSLISKPDSDVRLEPGSGAKAEGGGGKAGGDLMETEEINLDEELRQADLASQARKSPTQVGKSPTTGARPAGQSQIPGLKTQLPGSPTRTMLPTTSPFELSEADLDMPSSLSGSAQGLSSGSLAGDSGVSVGDLSAEEGDSGMSSPGASEFELTLAPEDEMMAPTLRPLSQPKSSPLDLGSDEDVELGGPLPASDLASNRAELSGINLHKPSDSGRSLEGGGSSDKVDFELTLDDEGVSGPKTLKGKMSDIDSDSEFELTVDDSSTSMGGGKSSPSQKDIFETDSFDMPSEDESASQAVALEEQDTDLESSDFDLALDGDGGSTDSQELSMSEVGELSESSMEMDAPRKTKVLSRVSSDDSMSGVDSLMDEELTQTSEQSIEEEEAEDEEALVPTVPSAEADWGIYPLIMMIPCVLIMFLAGLMSYELVHSMWGYHQTTKPSGLIVEGFANLFKSDEAPVPAPGPAKQ